jgi:hypothetical protein
MSHDWNLMSDTDKQQEPPKPDPNTAGDNGVKKTFRKRGVEKRG